jgi:predicted nuclease of predicted toxin-antitoxin system
MPSKKQSGTKLSRYEKQLRECAFFLDRNLGRKWAADALRQAGARVEVHDDHFAQDVPDEEWLAFCGKHNWIVLTLDYRIRYRINELEALKRNKTKAFLIARAGQMNREELSGLLVRSLPKLVALIPANICPVRLSRQPIGRLHPAAIAPYLTGCYCLRSSVWRADV